MLRDWCKTHHEAKLLLLTRHALHPAPECHHRLGDIEKALDRGLPENDAIQLFRQRLKDTRIEHAPEPLIREVAQRLHRIPLAIEQFAGYLRLNEQGIDFDQRFVDSHDLPRLHADEQIEAFLLRLIDENVKLLDAASLQLMQVVAWAGIPVPISGLLALKEVVEAEIPPLLTRLVNSNMLLPVEGTIAEGRSFDMHPLIREALAPAQESSHAPIAFDPTRDHVSDSQRASDQRWYEKAGPPRDALSSRWTHSMRCKKETGCEKA